MFTERPMYASSCNREDAIKLFGEWLGRVDGGQVEMTPAKHPLDQEFPKAEAAAKLVLDCFPDAGIAFAFKWGDAPDFGWASSTPGDASVRLVRFFLARWTS